MVLPFQELISQDPLVTAVFFIVSYFVLGFVIKFIDDAFDEHAYPRKVALVLAPLLAIFWAYVMALDPASFVLLTAINIGVLVKGKIDNVAFIIGLLCIYVVYFFIGDFSFLLLPAYFLPLIIIAIAGVLDEIGNDFIDKNNIYLNMKPFGKYIYLFFEYRCVMKIAVLVFALLGSFAFLFFIAFLVWDIGYEIVMNITKRVVRNRKFYYNPRLNNY